MYLDKRWEFYSSTSSIGCFVFKTDGLYHFYKAIGLLKISIPVLEEPKHILRRKDQRTNMEFRSLSYFQQLFALYWLFWIENLSTVH